MDSLYRYRLKRKISVLLQLEGTKFVDIEAFYADLIASCLKPSEVWPQGIL